ncbi:hypothetical protein [Sphingobium yanoikuyae]|uniref:Uncharacterized protein n=1 Tax=Sphingobium yanoikuyae ATCC 51230 TaxID=883163 RepID=K9CUK8_SPHYA|nr:hypothetical protein [Sphingobium yanoikuyae]EKU74616.1 hypothetical protein HMPREF9718_02144 [Sphingobium yanoikuyae ATCC 51230]WQE06536.1 hypothetical protein U0025_19895 [Sphingobium yanoikuyae]
MKDQFQGSPEEAAQSAISLALSAFNGVFALAAAMAGRGILSKGDVEYLHAQMLAPLDNRGAIEAMMAAQSQKIDELCSIMATLISQNETPKP